MSSQASLAIAPTTEGPRPRSVVRPLFGPSRELPTGPAAQNPMTVHDRFVACALAIFPGSTLVEA